MKQSKKSTIQLGWHLIQSIDRVKKIAEACDRNQLTTKEIYDALESFTAEFKEKNLFGRRSDSGTTDRITPKKLAHENL
jgi:hypothetical protein